jgi:hypothetical protein
MENVDCNSISDTEERLIKELDEFSAIENFKSLFDTNSVRLDEVKG